MFAGHTERNPATGPLMTFFSFLVPGVALPVTRFRTMSSTVVAPLGLPVALVKGPLNFQIWLSGGEQGPATAILDNPVAYDDAAALLPMGAM